MSGTCPSGMRRNRRSCNNQEWTKIGAPGIFSGASLVIAAQRVLGRFSAHFYMVLTKSVFSCYCLFVIQED